MDVCRVGVYLLTYLVWLGGVFALLFFLRSRLFPDLRLASPMLFVISSAVTGGITVAQAARKRRR